MEYKISGVRLCYNACFRKDNLTIKISYLTALFFVEDEHIGSVYPQGIPDRILHSILKSYREEYQLQISDTDISEIVEWIREQI